MLCGGSAFNLDCGAVNGAPHMYAPPSRPGAAVTAAWSLAYTIRQPEPCSLSSTVFAC
jgi:hypothetical protein